MQDFDVQTVELEAPFDVAFRYVADPQRLPDWTHAFRSVSVGRAKLATPKGEVEGRVGGEASRRTEPWTG
jgi:uncharacterized membrane protein